MATFDDSLRSWRRAAMLALCGALLVVARPAHAMEMIGSYPSARTVIEGRNAQYVVRFDSVINHRSSRLTIVQKEQLVRSLPIILRSDPKALTASAPRLPSGAYELHWYAYSMSGETNEGSVPFTVAP